MIIGSGITTTTAWQDRTRKVEILIDETICTDGTESNFPVLLVDDDTRITLPQEMLDSGDSNRAQSDGGDILAYDNGNSDAKNGYQTAGTNPATISTDRIPIEIVHFTQGAGTAGVAEIWVAVPTINCDDQNKDRSIVLYYGGTSGKSQPGEGTAFGREDVWCEGTWASCNQDFELVLHFSESSSPSYDATANDNDGTWQNNVVQDSTWANCTIGTCVDLDGTDDSITFPENGSLDMSGDATFEFWVNQDTLPGANLYASLLEKGTDYGSAANYSITLRADGSNALVYAADIFSDHADDANWATNPDIADDTWEYYTYAVDISATDAFLYQDGASVSSDSTFSWGAVNNTATEIGEAGSLFEDFDGWFDEIRISSVLRSADWLLATHNTIINSNTVALEQTPSGI